MFLHEVSYEVLHILNDIVAAFKDLAETEVLVIVVFGLSAIPHVVD